MATIYRKTEKGQTEIATRQFKLAPRLRSALIMIDGRRTDADLAGLIGAQADEVFMALSDGGFIEPVAALASPRIAEPAQVDALIDHDNLDFALPSTAPSTLPPDEPAPPPRSVAETRRVAARWLSDALGPSADGVNLRIERAQTPDEFYSALALALTVIRAQLGAERARRFELEVIQPSRPR